MKNKLFLIIAGGFVGLLIIFIAVASFMKKDNASGEGTEQQEQPIIVAQNDYAGAYQRYQKIQNDVLEIMTTLQNHNYEVQQGNPTDYWAEDNYFFLDFMPVYDEDMQYTSALNEIDDFSAISEYISGILQANRYDDVSVVKNEKNNYVLTYQGFFLNKSTWVNTYGKKIMEVVYDPAKNRFKVSSEILFNGATQSTPDFFCEFAEVKKGVYVLQSDKERLYVKYNDSNVEEFYYSSIKSNKAIDMRNNFLKTEIDELILSNEYYGVVYPVPNRENLYVGYMPNNSIKFFTTYIAEDGGLMITEDKDYVPETDISMASVKGFYEQDTDSIFLHLADIDSNWAFEAESFSETISFKDKIISLMKTDDFTGDVYEFSVKQNEPEQTETDAAE